MIKRKFTLTEVMAVMTIIVIILSIGVSGYRSMTSISSFIIEGQEVDTFVKRSIEFSVRSGTPSMFTVQMGKTQSERTYLYGGKNALRFSFDFDGNNASDDWDSTYGFRNVQLQTVTNETCVLSDYGMCYHSDGTEILLVADGGSTSHHNLSEAPFGIYAECKIKSIEGAQDTINQNGVLIELQNARMYINQSGELITELDGAPVPSDVNGHKRYKVETGDWVKVGMAIVTYGENVYMVQFVDGKAVDSYQHPTATFDTLNFNSDPSFCENYIGYIDDIRIYDNLQGEVLSVDPKAGFLVTSSGKHSSGNSISTVLLDGAGRFVPLTDSGVDATNSHGNDWESEMIGFASSSIYTSFHGQQNNHSQSVLQFLGSRSSQFPESGWFLMYHKNHGEDDLYEVVKYSDFDGRYMAVERAKVNTSKKTTDFGNNNNQNFRARLLRPIILNKDGGYQ